MNYDTKLLPAESATNTPAQSEAHALVDAHSVRAREAERAQLRSDIDAFLAQGGKVTTLEANRRVDLPKAPQNNYGQGSI